MAIKPTNTISCLTRGQYYTNNKFERVEYIYYLVILADDHTLGHMAWDLSTRYIENYWFIKTNNSHSAYALHILKNGHEYYTLPMTMKLMKKMNVYMTDQVHAYAKQQEKF